MTDRQLLVLIAALGAVSIGIALAALLLRRWN